MNNQEYIMIGTKIITKELFRNILRPLNNLSFKPNGGFWASPYTPYYISSWFQYLRNNPDYLYYKNIFNASLFKLSDKANILTIDNNQILENIIKNYPSYGHLLNFYNRDAKSINYELLSKDYDGIYLENSNFYNSPYEEIFKSWSVDTLLLFNLDVIDSYKSIEINFYSPDNYEYPYFKNKQELSIEEESIYHKEIFLYIEDLFMNLVNTKTTFTDYNDYFSYLIECTKKCIKIAIINKEKEANKIRKHLLNKNINTTNYIIIRNISTNVLSNYLKNNVNIEKELPKTRVKKYLEYPIDENQK